MGMVLGLSLTSDDVVWVLVDPADRSVADHDSVDVTADTEIAHAAARGAQAIANAGGLVLDRVRVTWTDDVARDGLRLRSQLSCLGFDDVDAVPLRSAGAVMVDPELDPSLALAYGAALADVEPHEALTEPVHTRPVATRRARRAAMVLGAAAVAAVGGLLFVPGSPLQIGHAAATADQPAAAEPGWVAVPAPTDGAATTQRKVVAALTVEVPAAAAPVQAPTVQAAPEASEAAPMVAVEPTPLGVPHLPAEVPHLGAPPAEAAEALQAAAPEAVPAEAQLAEALPAEPAQAAQPIPTEQPHLPPELVAAGPVAVGPAEAPAPDMTVSANLSTQTP